ncbi:hypothetical protein [Burkholderia multivorans]|uniref:hypothetical protein n=1 Tax=Burkholderia multivorans TaxID=87883 RepID=UPI000D019275|nr:hypothetical protein [Burkholderia multivorans]PRH46395.1 hypothetical protein C6V05_20935 [Burkholderia multivorans]
MGEREMFEATLVELSRRDEETFDKPFPNDDINVLWALWQAARRTTPDRDAVIEECAKVCDEYAADQWSLYKGRAPYTGSEPGRADPDVQGRSDGADVCASRIRELKAAPTAALSSDAADDKNVYVSVRFKDAVVRRSITTAELDSLESTETLARLFGSVVLGAIDAARARGHVS